MIEEDLIKKMINGKENNQFDRKLKITSKSKIAKTISSFANTDGGFILIGVTDDHKLVGIDSEEEKYMINSANELFCFPPAQLTFEEYVTEDFDSMNKEEKEISLLIVYVAKSLHDKIFVKINSDEKKAYIRIEDQCIAVE